MKALVLFVLLLAGLARACSPDDGQKLRPIESENETGWWYYCEAEPGQWSELYFEGKTKLEITPRRERISDIIKDPTIFRPAKTYKPPKV